MNVNVVMLFEYALKIHRMRWSFASVPDNGRANVNSWFVPLPVWLNDYEPSSVFVPASGS